MKIKNEKTVLYGTAVKVSDGMNPHRVVLRFIEDELHPYVTHMESMKVQDPNTLVHDAFYWGHYFAKKEDAENDFNERSNGF